jgi:alpha-L-fucosidase
MPLQPAPTPGKTDWFVHDRFGMFIHFGLYAMPARHEWVKSVERLTDEHYQRYFDRFDPDLCDPVQWARDAKAAGMKYFVVTTKHHDGFCLWDSQQTDYKVTNTPYGKDLIGPLVTAMRNEGLRVGLYHSLIDWHHPEFPTDMIHPRREDEEYKARDAERDISKYAAYLHAQVEELVTWFGQIDILWFDYSYTTYGPGGKGKDDWQSEKLLEIVRKHQPDVIVNNRLEVPQDIHTPEQYQPREWFKVDGQPVVWEACQTFSGSWGYYRDEHTWRAVPELLRTLIDCVSKGGNLLLNVGPTARGTFDDRARARLAGMGEWMALHSRSVVGCTQSDFPAPTDCRFTQNGKRLYCHIFAWPFKHLHLDGLAGKVDYAQLLNDGSELRVSEAGDTLTIELPAVQPRVEIPVVEMWLK